MTNPVTETIETLKKARQYSSSAIVAFSGGKDSLCVMDMACRTFDHVEGLFKYLVPDLESTEAVLEPARKRWGVKFHLYVSQNTIKALRDGSFCKAIPELQMLDSWNIYASAIKSTGIPLVLTGMKRSDSQSRRRLLKWSSWNEHLIHPIVGWEKKDVLGYLRSRGIPIPDSSGRASTGVELHPDELLFLYDHYPDDFETVRQYFPYVEAVIKHRQFYPDFHDGKKASSKK
jgi:3'-phosphoadenosine 5'-phosphosulfate sulfotransferase (PAPS reductase)/FAD synthetase